MVIAERQLEEDEAKVDNILHKILLSADKIKIVADEIGGTTSEGVLKEKFSLLAGTITNLAMLADEITLHEEQITEELDVRIREELKIAIEKINDIREMFGENISA